MSFTHSPVVDNVVAAAVADVVEMSSDLRKNSWKRKILPNRTHRIRARKKSKNNYHSVVELSTRVLKVGNFDFKYEIKFRLSKNLKKLEKHVAIRFVNCSRLLSCGCGRTFSISATSNICSVFYPFQCYFLIKLNLIQFNWCFHFSLNSS